MKRKAFPPQYASGFTLIELMVVLGVVALLASLLLPGLSLARARARSSLCQNNLRQLSLASLLYLGDHQDQFPYNLGSAATHQSIAEGSYLNWVNNVLSWELDPENTNATLVARGGLAPYTTGNPVLYRCPEDSVLSELQKNAGWRERTRSISLNAMIGNAGDFILEGRNINNPAYRQFFKASEIRDSQRIFTFVEEHPDSINDAYFLNKPQVREWIDLPASYHNGAANLTFADGHLESKKWVHPSTRSPARPGGALLPSVVPEDELGDFYWLMSRTTLKDYRPTISGP